MDFFPLTYTEVSELLKNGVVDITQSNFGTTGAEYTNGDFTGTDESSVPPSTKGTKNALSSGYGASKGNATPVPSALTPAGIIGVRVVKMTYPG